MLILTIGSDCMSEVRSVEIESETTNLCMGIMQDNLCHPYILSITVLSDMGPSNTYWGL